MYLYSKHKDTIGSEKYEPKIIKILLTFKALCFEHSIK